MEGGSEGHHTGAPLSNQHSSSLESMETMRTSMVSPQSADLNFDAFDILDLPDFDGDHLPGDVSSSTTTTVVPASTTTSITPTTTVAPPAPCAGCNQTTSTEVKVESRAGLKLV